MENNNSYGNNQQQGQNFQGQQGNPQPRQQQTQNQQTGLRPPSNLHNLVSYSWSGTSLLEVSLVYEPQDHERKRPYFCFLKLLPGGKNQATGERTYIPDNQICLKLAIDKVQEFAKALKAHAMGHHAAFGPYSNFTDTSKAARTSENTKAGTKSLYMMYDAGQRNPNGDFIRGKEPKVLLTASITPKGQQKRTISYPMTPYMAAAISDTCEMIAHKGCELEMDRQIKCSRQKAKQLQQ